MEAVGLQTHIWNNNLRSAFLLAGFPVLLLGMVFFIVLGMVGAGYLPSQGDAVSAALGYMLAATPLAVGVSLIWFAIAYFANVSIIDALTGARLVTRNEEPDLYNLLENLCISRGLPMPALHVIETDALNAFASGVSQKQYAVTVTRGLMRTLNRDELEAVLGHELTHILSRDVRTMVIASVFAGIITLLAQVVFRAVMWGGVGRSSRDDRKGGNFVFVLIALAVAAIGYVLAIVIRMALSRQREFVADAGAVALTKNPDAMISALQKISGHSQIEAPDSVRGMFIENGRDGGGMSAMGLFDTHPPIEKRIAALVQYAGGRVSEPSDMPPFEAPVASAPEPDYGSQIDPTADAGPWGDRRPSGPWG